MLIKGNVKCKLEVISSENFQLELKYLEIDHLQMNYTQ